MVYFPCSTLFCTLPSLQSINLPQCLLHVLYCIRFSYSTSAFYSLIHMYISKCPMMSQLRYLLKLSHRSLTSLWPSSCLWKTQLKMTCQSLAHTKLTKTNHQWHFCTTKFCIVSVQRIFFVCGHNYTAFSSCASKFVKWSWSTWRILTMNHLFIWQRRDSCLFFWIEWVCIWIYVYKYTLFIIMGILV